LFDPQRLGTPEAIIDCETGFLVDSGNIEDITDKVVKILQDSELVKELGENGRNNVGKLSWEKVADRFRQAVGEKL
jgi:glycosyltransferase involved in cell wall biosynthesis